LTAPAQPTQGFSLSPFIWCCNW